MVVVVVGHIAVGRLDVAQEVDHARPVERHGVAEAVEGNETHAQQRLPRGLEDREHVEVPVPHFGRGDAGVSGVGQ